MSAFTIERKTGSPENALARARRETVDRGGSFEGDLESGRFRMQTPLGPIDGTYSVVGDTVRFEVLRKPMLVHRMLIEGVLDQFFST
jgi:hypothetical protein